MFSENSSEQSERARDRNISSLSRKAKLGPSAELMVYAINYFVWQARGNGTLSGAGGLYGQSALISFSLQSSTLDLTTKALPTLISFRTRLRVILAKELHESKVIIFPAGTVSILHQIGE